MDIGTDSNGDLLATGGDWAVLESTGEHQKSLILDNKGDYKYAPLTCAGAINYIDSERPQDFLNAVSVQFAGDGMTVNQVAQLASGKIEVDAYYR